MVAWTGVMVMAGEMVRRKNDRSSRVLGSRGARRQKSSTPSEFLTCPARQIAPQEDGAAGRSEVTFDFKHNEFEGFMIPPHGDVE